MALSFSYPWCCKVWVFQLIFLCFLSIADAEAQQLHEKADSVTQSTKEVVEKKQQQADSLMNKKLAPIDKVTQKADSVTDLLDADQQINGKIHQAENAIQEKVNTIEEVEQSKEALGNIERETGLKPDADAPAMPKLAGEDPAIDLPTDKINDVKALPDEQLSKIKEIKAVEKAGSIREEVSSYQEDVKAVSEGNLSDIKQAPQAIEQKAMQTKELQELQKQSEALEQVKQQPDQLKGQVEQYKDKDYIKKQAQTKLKEKAINHFAGRNQELEAAQKELSKLKQKYSHVQTEKGVYVKASSLKGKPLKERLVLGSSLQIHAGGNPAFDLSPFAGFRFNKRWSTALGGTYRLAFDHENKITIVHPVYGGRIFTEALLHKTFLLHGEYELLRANVPSQMLPQEQQRAWVDGVMVGVGKQYNITKKLKGNVLTLYNFSYKQQGPYQLRWNIRFGFLIF